MGYSTDFNGSFQLNKPLSEKMKTFLTKFAQTRRMGRRQDEKKYGIQGEFFVDGTGSFGQGNDKDIIDHNTEPCTQPGLWCQWIPSEDGTEIKWDGGEKFYNYTEWLVYLIHKILKPNGYVLNGSVEWQGEETGDVGEITVKNNKVFTKEWKGKKQEHTPATCRTYRSSFKKVEGVGADGYATNYMRTDVVFLEDAVAGDGEQEFEVTVSRTVTAVRTIKVKAKDIAQAKETALNEAGNYDFGTGDNPEYEVKHVSPHVTKTKNK